MNKQMPLSIGKSPLSLPATTTGAKVFTGREIVGMFRRRLWLIIIITSLSTIIFTMWCVATLMLNIWPFKVWPGKEYTSYAQIKCSMPIRDNPLMGTEMIPHKDIIELETRTRALSLNREGFLRKIFDRVAVQGTEWYTHKNDDQSRLKYIKKCFNAQEQRNSSIIVLSMTTSNGKESQIILDEILIQFNQDDIAQAGDKLDPRRTNLDFIRAGLQTRINDTNAKLIRELTATNEPGFEEGQSRAWEEYKLMHNEILILDAQIQNARNELQNMQDNAADYLNAVQLEVESNPQVAFLNNQITDSQSRLAQVSQRLGKNHQQVKQLTASIDRLQIQSDTQRQDLMDRYFQMQQMIIIQELASKELQLKSVTEKYEAAESVLENLSGKRIEFMTIQTELEDLKAQWRRLDDRINELDIQRDRSWSATATVVAPATLPLGIANPRLIKYIPMGFILGLMFSVGLILFMEFVDDSVKSPSDVRRYLNIPLLGMIPRHEDGDTDLLTVAKIAYTQPQAMLSEAFRQVRTNLYFSAPAEDMKTILITSSSASCGKTTVAVNLAITLAAEGKRILLVDTNFRRAAINRLFGAEGPPRGLSNILVGQVPAAEVIRQSDIEGLDLVDAGPAPPNPSVLLSGARMPDFLESQKQYYDHIILDGPPTLIVTDARIIAGMVDGTIAVVHAGDTSRGVVQRMIGELKNNQVNILGVLLNAVRALKGGYFSESYRSYYEYISAEAIPTRSLPEKAGHDLVES